MASCPEVIQRLIERFDQQLDQVRSPDYNETQLRIDFVNPMFRQLGWDIDNTQGFAEQYREVVHEDRVLVAGANKAPDYSFRIGGVRKFFVETKKPFVNIKDNWEPAYQLRRYGWSAKLTVSILTDFEELAVYDCRIAPKQLDKASTARRDFIAYRDYCDRWDFIEGTFSKQAVLRGDFDRYCQTKKGRGAQEFDEAFLEEIEQWRQKLASNLALRNDDLDEQALNFAVQRIIDRIIFLRICEDRGTEHVGQLQALLNGEKVYARLQKLFRDADARYNSGLFHFRKEPGRDENPDELTPRLEVDDAALKGIIRRLYYPESPYEFTMVSADILGSVYERFLGKVIRKTDHRAKVEEKPEVRKAGGVYYTPAYIVDYIVKQTVGKLLENCKSPKDAAKLKILDPACGSGSFLIGAYQHLIDWHLQWYVKDGADKWSKGKNAAIRPADRPTMAALIQMEEAGAIANPAAGHWALTIKERKRILLDNIHGVDIDYQAVEVTKLSLLLKVLEGETAESLGGLWTLFRERALPDLGRNIQCGNSLVGTDVTATDAWGEMSPLEHRQINPFDYERGFEHVFAQGRFDAVIGNPPYVRSINLKASSLPLWQLTRARYKSSADREWDLYMVFVERGLQLLSKRGKLGYILPNKFFTSQVGANLRSLIVSGNHLETLINFGAYQVFEKVTTYTTLLFLTRSPAAQLRAFTYRGPLGSGPCSLELTDLSKWSASTLSADMLAAGPWDLDRSTSGIFTRRADAQVLGDQVDIFQGTGTRADRVFLVEYRGTASKDLVTAWSDALEEEVTLETSLLKPALRGRAIERYRIERQRTRLIVPYVVDGERVEIIPERTLASLAPRVLAYLRKCRSRLNERENGRFAGGDWYCYGRPQNMHRFGVPEKIVLPDIVRRGQCVLDTKGLWLLDTAYGLVKKPDALLDLRVVLALLNSPVLTFFLKKTGTPLRGGYFRMKTAYLRPFPLPLVSREQSLTVVKLVDAMLSLQGAAVAAKRPQEAERLRREIDATDRRIDQLVYELYGLTHAEIRLVEAATP